MIYKRHLAYDSRPVTCFDKIRRTKNGRRTVLSGFCRLRESLERRIYTCVPSATQMSCSGHSRLLAPASPLSRNNDGHTRCTWHHSQICYRSIDMDKSVFTMRQFDTTVTIVSTLQHLSQSLYIRTPRWDQNRGQQGRYQKYHRSRNMVQSRFPPSRMSARRRRAQVTYAGRWNVIIRIVDLI